MSEASGHALPIVRTSPGKLPVDTGVVGQNDSEFCRYLSGR
jgi:hypothetical protein